MKHKIPEIRIQSGDLLYKTVSPAMFKMLGEKGDAFGTEADLHAAVDEFCEAWKPLSSDIINGMCDITGLGFEKNIIPVYIVPWLWPISDPLIMHTNYEPDEFVDALTHELIHNLLADNTSGADIDEVINRWAKLFGGHNHKTLIHIPLHAVLKAIYLDVLKDPARLERDIKESIEADDRSYKKAWDYVEKHDYKKIIERVRTSYKA